MRRQPHHQVFQFRVGFGPRHRLTSTVTTTATRNVQKPLYMLTAMGLAFFGAGDPAGVGRVERRRH